MIKLTHVDEFDRRWKEGSGEQVTSHLYRHSRISRSVFCCKLQIVVEMIEAWDH